MDKKDKNRIGKFSLNDAHVFSDLHSTSEIFCKLQFVPFRAEHLSYCAKTEYIGWSPHFDAIGNCEMVPVYEFVFRNDDKGKLVSISILRKKDA